MAKKKARAPRKKASAGISPLVTEMSKEQIDEMMDSCDKLQGELRFLTLHLLIEQKQRMHERRMSELKRLGSAVAYLPVAVVSNLPKVGRVIRDKVGAFIASMRKPAESQETPS